MMRLRFSSALPPTKRGKYERTGDREHNEIADALKAHPFEWALVDEGLTKGQANGFAVAIRQGKYLAYEGGGFEATTRVDDEGTYSLWARWTGA